MVTFDLFVTPTLALLTGADRPPRQTTAARLSRSIASAAGREDYVQVRLEERNGERWAVPVFGKSNLIYTLVHADGMVKVELDDNGLAEGTLVPVILF
jgi:molybdopterin molybdotransferase